MTSIYTRTQIEDVLPAIDVVQEIADGFVSFSRGEVEVPPVGELLFPKHHGEFHIKYGAIRGDDVFVVKLATGFFNNPGFGLPPFGGCMLVLSQETGMIEAILLEEGELTNHRTAAAGAVAAKALAPANVSKIGIVGTGVQARLQADYLRRVNDCRNITIWRRRSEAIERAAADIAAMGFNVDVSATLEHLCENAQLIVTTTPSDTPLLTRDMVRPGTHITAIGSDTPDKNEVAPEVLAVADLVVADSLAQSEMRGEIFQARQAGLLDDAKINELGDVLTDPSKGRASDSQISLADLTGVAVQDIAIAKAILSHLKPGNGVHDSQ